MTLSYNREADALYIRLLDGEFSCRVVRITEDIALHAASEERLVGIEVFKASRLFEKPDSPSIVLQNLLPRIVPT